MGFSTGMLIILITYCLKIVADARSQCGQCYEVTYNGNTIHIIAIDHTLNGLNLSKAALNTLTGGRAEEVGRVDATVTRVDSGVCGLRASKRTIEFMG